MGQITMIASAKGGSGKSTVAASLGAALVKRGKSVILLDADSAPGSLDLMLGAAEQAVYHLADVLEDRCEPQQAVYEAQSCPGLRLMASPTGLPEGVSPGRLRDLCRLLSESYDFVIVDTPPGTGQGVSLAAACAELALVVATPDPVCVRSAAKTAALLRDAGVECRLVVNRRRRRMLGRTAEDLDEIIDRTAAQLIGVIPEDRRAASAAGGVFFEEASPAGAAFADLAARLCGEERPLRLR